uniref:RING-type domain-containing protein n=1 Tax=Amphimedon queenslandica TaxID=400682 RepID=A0A1X7T9U9_AMPQE
MDWGQDGGYDCELIEDPPDELTCPICLLPIKSPHLITCCGRKLCHSCIYRVQQAGGPCPCCQEKEYYTVLDKMVERQVLDLKVYCKYKSKGCPWTGELCDLEGHLKSCFETAFNRNKELLSAIQKMQGLLSNKIDKEKETERTIKTLKDENEQLKEQLHQLNKQSTTHSAHH